LREPPEADLQGRKKINNEKGFSCWIIFVSKNRAKKVNYFPKPSPLSIGTNLRANAAMGTPKNNPAIVDQIT